MLRFRNSNSDHLRPPRRGGVVLEFILVMAILITITAAFFQFGAISLFDATIESAVDEGAREAAKAAATATLDSQIVDAAEDAVNTIFSVHGLTVDPTDGSGIRVIVDDETGTIGTRGDSTLTPNNTFPAPFPGELRVITILSFDPDAPNGDPIPNFLSTLGVDFTGRQFEVSSIAKKE